MGAPGVASHAKRKGALPPPPEKAPPLPKLGNGIKWHPSTVKWWRVTWASGWAGIYTDQDYGGLVRLAHLMDKQHRVYDGATVTKDTKDGPIAVPMVMQGTDYTAISALEDRFGLTPRARQVLRWESAAEQTGEVAKSAPKEPKATISTSDRQARLSGLRAV
jgi:hypothetical protein